MAKRAQPKKRQSQPIAQIELRRWCIEQAIRWPVSMGSYPSNMTSAFHPQVEADVIGRAKQLLDWVLDSQRAA